MLCLTLFVSSGVLPNVLLTSCEDNICRIWAQTPNLDPQHTHQSIDVDSSFAIGADFKFHIAAIIDPDNDIPLLPDVSRGQDVPLTIHWLNNKTWMYNAVIERNLSSYFEDRLTGNASVSRSSFDSLTAADYESVQLEVDVSDGSGVSCAPSSVPLKTLTVPTQRKGAISPAREAALQALKQSDVKYGSTRASIREEQEGASLRQSIGNVLKDWRRTSDMVFAVYPTDGSLLLWQLDHLDDLMPSLRLVHVSFSSRLPFSFPLEDAYSMSPELILLSHIEAFSVGHPVAQFSPLRKSSTRELGHHASNVSLARSSAFSSLQQLSFRSSMEEAYCSSPYPWLSLFSRHLDGSINLWHVELGDDPLRICCVVHRRRSAGHRFGTTKLVVHPTLPIVLTAAHIEDLSLSFSMSGSEEFQLVDSLSDIQSKTSELILWETRSVGSLAQHSALDQLAVVSSGQLSAFTSIAWIPAAVPSCDDLSNRLCGSLFLANEDGSSMLYFHLALVDAANLLYHSHWIKKEEVKHYRSTSLSMSSTDSDLDMGDEEKPAVVSLADVATVISTQSGHRPGCIIKLGLLDETSSRLFRFSSIVFLHVFCSSSFSPNVHRALQNQARMKNSILTKSVIGSQEFYIVAISSALQRSQAHLGDRLIRFHMWYVQVSPYAKPEEKSDKQESTGESAAQPAATQSSSDGTIPIPNVESVYLGAQELNLPSGVTLEHVTTIANKKQAFFYELVSKPALYLITTLFSDGQVMSWTCQLCSRRDDSKDRYFEWKEWPDKLSGIKSNASINVNGTVSCEAVAVSSPCCALLACGHRCTKSDCSDVVVSIWQCRSTGGASWMLADLITVDKIKGSLTEKKPRLALDWVSVEDGSFVLAVATQRGIMLLAECFRDNKRSSENSAETRFHSESWDCLRFIELDSDNVHSSSLGLAWTGTGTLILASQSELQVLSQWTKEAKSNTISVLSVLSKVPRQKDTHSMAYDGSMFEQAAAMTPMLIQYHPDQLLQLLSAGKLQRVRAILGNLVVCLRERTLGDESRQRKLSGTNLPRPRLGSLGKVLSLTVCPGEKAQTYECIESITPLSLTDLVLSDHTNFQTQEVNTTNNNSSTTTSDGRFIGDGQYESLFSRPSLTDEFIDGMCEGEEEQDDIDPIKPGHFSPQHSKWLANQLTRFQLPGLSNVDQIRLLAVAETVASTQGSFKGESSNPLPLLSSAAGAGYAQASGKDTSSVDDCGLRCLLSLHFYQCLLKSLPPTMRSKAAKQGLASSDFAWAFHSESEEELLSMVPALQRLNLSWADLRAVGIGWWVRSDDRLRRCVEKVCCKLVSWICDLIVRFFVVSKSPVSESSATS